MRATRNVFQRSELGGRPPRREDEAGASGAAAGAFVRAWEVCGRCEGESRGGC
jgi:hypothetical protein